MEDKKPTDKIFITGATGEKISVQSTTGPISQEDIENLEKKFKFQVESKPETEKTRKKKKIKRELLDKTTKTRIPPKLKEVLDKTTKFQYTKKHYEGIEKQGNEIFSIWKNKDVDCLIRQVDLLKLNLIDKEGDIKNPKNYVYEDKTVKFLMGLVGDQQFGKKKEDRKAECIFTLRELAEAKGYSEEEIKRGGGFFNDLNKDIESRAFTFYRLTIGKEKKVFYGTLLNLLKSPNKDLNENRYEIRFNSFFSDEIEKMLKTEAKQYFTYSRKEIADRNTTEKPYLHLFYNQLIKRKQPVNYTIPVKIINLLEDMGIADRISKRPQEIFKILKECIIYFGKNYPEELESIKLYNNFYKEDKKIIPLSIEELEKKAYKKFKKTLESIGIKDIREALISFIRPYNKLTEKKALPEPDPMSAEEKDLISQILSWADFQNIGLDNMTNLNKKDTEKFLEGYIRRFGFTQLKKRLEEENSKGEPKFFDFHKAIKEDMRSKIIDKAD